MLIDKSNEKYLECILVLITLALGVVLNSIEHSRIVVLNLFFLPIVLSGFFLGRYRAGVLALLSAVTVTVVILADLNRFAIDNSPLIVGLSVMIWGAILGLTAILIGTLNDDRNEKMDELHEAHLGVVEVLSRYLQCADPILQSRTQRVNHLSEQVAIRMRMTPREIDDVRIAALLMDVSNIEITARVVRKAVGDLDRRAPFEENTFHGTELVKSLGSALTGAFPLALLQNSNWETTSANVPIGARILRVVRQFVELTQSGLASTRLSDKEALHDLKIDCRASDDMAVINVLEEVTDKMFDLPSGSSSRQKKSAASLKSPKTSPAAK